MKVKVIEKNRNCKGELFSTRDLLKDKIYEANILELPYYRKIETWYKIIDESGESHLYPPEMFEIMEV